MSSSVGTDVVVVLDVEVVGSAVVAGGAVVVGGAAVVVGDEAVVAGDADDNPSSLPPQATRVSAMAVLSDVSGVRFTATTLGPEGFGLTSRCARTHPSDIRTEAQTLH